MATGQGEGALLTKRERLQLAVGWAVWFGNTGARLTERAAFKTWETGSVPAWAWKSPKLGEPDDIRESRKHCPECGEWHKLDSAHWHKNSYGKRGWHSICAGCRRAARTLDYKRKKALATS